MEFEFDAPIAGGKRPNPFPLTPRRCRLVLPINENMTRASRDGEEMTSSFTADDAERTADVMDESGLSFEDLLLPDAIMRGLRDNGFRRPSPVQIRGIPAARFGCDLIAQAKSGTGKTLVFAISIIENIVLSNPHPQAVVIAPTREIATQIRSVVSRIGRHLKGFSCVAFIGGQSRAIDRKKIARRCHVAVGTPGRLADLIERKILVVTSVRVIVLDEADQLHGGSFGKIIKWIVSSMPSRKQIMAFSATYTNDLLGSIKTYMRDPLEVRISSSRARSKAEKYDVALRGVEQYFVKSSTIVPRTISDSFQAKTTLLSEVLANVRFRQAVVFYNDKQRAHHLARKLRDRGWPCQFISGDQKQRTRQAVVAQFRSFRTRVLVTTDLTARGVDFTGVDLVVNMDIPADAATYLHRVGRAGRFGTRGLALTLIARDWEMPTFEALTKTIGVSIPRMPESPQTRLASRVSEPVTSRDACDKKKSTSTSSAAGWTETRVDPADGRFYTQREFLDFYGGSEQWERASPLKKTTAAHRYPGERRQACTESLTADSLAETSQRTRRRRVDVNGEGSNTSTRVMSKRNMKRGADTEGDLWLKWRGLCA